MRPVISLKGLSHMTGSRYLLKDINWDINQGDHWVVFGMNGSGKTTLLTILAGFKPLTHGSLTVFGEPYTNDNVLEIRKRIGLVSASFFDQYYTRESALDIVLSGKFGTFGIRYDIQDEDIIKARKLLVELHLGDKIDQLFNMMSKGERQNVLIARALFSNPEILIMDEPCTGLDVYAREHLLNVVRDLAEKTDIAIIYVTHYTEEILSVFDQCLLLRNGYCYTMGKTKEIFNTKSLSDFLRFPVDVKIAEDEKIYIKMDIKSNVRDVIRGSDIWLQ
ncbi:ABC-type molybdenum transport system, ATPase component/photorepair protein PhrA [Desulfosporosinus orientis DSM 765]|uniref:ABC-type molybdenum transport system, ATPase component/photorepair protein PhrA n=1 Tax=Desulfosporosinus orientis (strain ATCC 19365 / DSM 765 / NCIMB 8382 / VKM B-1628 / Singapore I) TaxID=768706 RepID=G7W660_DESOD|nr:ATP-binding cassette domain-containing protein [Desulfosporosinus orientis]AET67722.1 ABC-type molybdenum transport system, ATPase component/photorepair protein PhrA [Desulfosporosinus orientis DSM 765]